MPVQRPLKLVQLSDLHGGWFADQQVIAGWVKQCQQQQPDIIVITGDLVDAWFCRDLSSLEPLTDLQTPLGVWAIPGNHDRIHTADTELLRAKLAALGIELLCNSWHKTRDDTIIIGVQDYTDAPQQATEQLPPWFNQLAQELAREDANAGYQHARILLLHNPDFLPIVAASRCHVDLILCGHTHGGQIHLPALGPVYTSSRYGTRFVSGWQAEFPAYISRGLGVTSLPLRWRCPAELTTFVLEPDLPL